MKKQKLALNKETVGTLLSDRLREVVGGSIYVYTHNGCTPHVNTSIVGGTLSIPVGACGSPTNGCVTGACGGGGGGGEY